MITVNKKSNNIIYILLLFLIFSACMIAGGFWWYGNQKKLTKKHWEETLGSIAELKSNQIIEWRKDRVIDALLIAQGDLINTFFNEKKVPGNEKQALISWLKPALTNYGYDNILLLNKRGEVVFAATENYLRDLNESTMKLFNEALKAKKPLFGSFYYCQLHQAVHIDLAAPVIFWRDHQDEVMGGLIIIIDPSRFLFPLIQSWPTPSPTAETLLVKKRGDQVVFLNFLRHEKNQPLVLNLPLSDTHLPAARAIAGHEGVMEGIDYRGVPVLAVTKAIPDTPWHMVAKIDTAEIYHPLYREAKIIATGVISLILLVGAVLGWTLSAQRKRHYEALYSLECERQVIRTHLEYLVKHANDIILLMDQEGNLQEVNDRAVAAYGYTREELLQLNIRDLVQTSETPTLLQWNREDLAREGKIFEGYHLHRNGRSFPVEVSVNLIQVEEKEYFQEIIRDITERKQAEEAFQALVNHAPMGIFIVQNRKFAIVNPGFEKISGYSEKELIGNDSLSLVSSEYRQEVRQKAVAMLKGESQLPYEFPIITKERGAIWVMEKLASTVYQGQRAALGYFLDISEQKKLESQFLQAQKMEAVGRLAGGVAHDFNNLLNVITGYSEIMKLELKKQDQLCHYVEEIGKAADRASSLTQQLLAFGRKQIIQPRIINLNELISGMDKMLPRLLGEDLNLITLLDPALGAVKADPGQMDQVIMNLAVNARDAMPRGGNLTIATENVFLDDAYAREHLEVTPGPYVLLAVSDSGTGMDAATLAHIFEPFFTTKEPGKGTGLGLSTVHGIIKQNRGHIWVYSEPGRGTTVKIYLPRVEEAPMPLQPPEPPTTSLQGTETILVVEDDESLLNFISQALRTYGYTVLEARHGSEAILVCERHQGEIHLLLTDAVMPGLSGGELLERLAPLGRKMKVLFMSGYTEDFAALQGLLAAGVPFLQKPFRMATLAQKVRELLNTPGAE
jgi:PAS domain S-box-containing protein